MEHPFTPVGDWSSLTNSKEEDWADGDDDYIYLENRRKPLLLEEEKDDFIWTITVSESLRPAQRQFKRIARKLKDLIREVYYFVDRGLQETTIFGRLKSGEYFCFQCEGFNSMEPIVTIDVHFDTDPMHIYNFILTQEERNDMARGKAE